MTDATQAILAALADILDDEDAVRGKDAILAALAAAGFKIVGRDATEAMDTAASDLDHFGGSTEYKALWSAMWDAAP